MKTLKKLFLTLAVVIMAVVCFAFGAGALDKTGQCGENVYWNYNDYTGELVVSGTGNMWDDLIYKNGDGGSPFSHDDENGNNIKNVIINEGVTNIGKGAFNDCYSLKSITIADSVTSIGDYAFCDCYSLKSITIADSVTSIGKYAFCGCESLFSITISDNVTNIGNYAFSRCDKLVLYCYKNSCAEVYADAKGYRFACFDGTDEESVFSGKVGKYKWCLDKRTGVLELTGSGDMIDFTSVEAPWYEYRYYVTSLKLSDSLTKIGSNSFKDLYRINDIIIPDSVTYIGSSAFSSCNSIKSVTIPDGVTSIGERAFSSCNSLERITIPDGITWISNYAFYCCYNLESITIPDSVTWIGDYAFYCCNSLESITIPDSVTWIGMWTFYGCKSLTSITIPYNVTNVDNFALHNCYSIIDITFALNSKNQSKITSMPDIRFTKVKEIILPASISSVGAFPKTIEKVTVYNPKCSFNSSCGLGYMHTIVGFKGSTAEKFAEQIGAEFIDIETVHTHSYKTVETVKATCKVAGKTVGRCTCGKEKTTTIAKLAHNVVTVKGKAVTCTSTGLTEGKKCSVCGTVTVAQKTVAKKSHTYTTTTTKATLSKNGKVVKKCSVCGTVSSTSTIYYPKTITLSASSYTYNGKTKTPTVTVKDSKGKELKKDTDYTVKYESGRKSTGKYTVTVTFKGKYSGTKKLYFTITPKTTSKVTATQTTTSVTLKWSKVTGATGYRVFQRVNGKWKTLTNTTKLTYTVKKLKAGTNYTFAVRPYTVDGKDTILASTFTQLKTATKCKTPTLKATSSKKGVASLSWTNVAGESGYQVYYSTQKDGEYKKVKSYKTDVVTASKSKLTSGKTYYFKIRAYKKTDSGTVYGAWSAVKSIKIK